ncbi:hypothetical protein [Bacillus salacetis]|uniref:hypothetical protein n=1 Tax=Bacillus salacetis TaxID=2315464 RepID=UPI0014444AA6|nr:hypothetical protein [Bacillus salacetis]
MDPLMGAIILLLAIYLISRVAHFFNNIYKRINDMDRKLDEIKEFLTNKED